MIILLLYVESYFFIIETYEKLGNVIPYDACSISYNVPSNKTDRLQGLLNQCSKFKIKSYVKCWCNIAPSYLCELISRKESHVNARLGTDHHQLIMMPICKECSNIFLERSFIYAAPCEWNKLSKNIRTSNFHCFRK